MTQQVFSQLTERAATLNDQLIEQIATSTNGQMAEWAGYIKAIRDFVNIEFEGVDSNGH